MYTNDIAKLTNVHHNTVRLYEKWGYISPVPRQSNGYRIYSDLHLKQMQIARLAFEQEFIQNNLRKFATSIVKYSGREKFDDAIAAAKTYLSFLHSEVAYTTQAIETVQTIFQRNSFTLVTYSHKEIANQLQLSEDTIRNWERNGLFEVNRTTQNRRIYTELEWKKLLIIRTLRSAHFSIASIRSLFEELQNDNNQKDVHALLSSQKFQNDFYHVTDELEKNLNKAIINVECIIALLHTLK